MSWIGVLGVGDLVRTRRDVSTGVVDRMTGHTTVRRGTPGIVRDIYGWFPPRADVEFDGVLGRRVVSEVPLSDLRRSFGRGESAWERRRDFRRGVRLGLFLIALPGLIAVALYLLQGGSLGALVGAMIAEIMNMLAPFLPFLIVGLLVAKWWRGRRR